MASYNYKPGLGNVGSFQVSGAPFVTGGVNATSATRVSFPRVTRWIMVANPHPSQNVKIGFSENGVNGSNYAYLSFGSNTPRLELKVTEIWLSGSAAVNVMAGLTGIESTSINNSAVSPSGSNWSGSLGALVG